MSREEEVVRSVTRALAGTVTEVRPLRLPATAAAPGGGSRQRPPRRWPRWAAPVTAAAVVIALAVALVIVRDTPNGGGVTPAAPAHSIGGVPGYFAELTPYRGSQTRFGLLVGDTFTGKTVATIAPPAGASFWGVSAAAGDRTFAVFAAPPDRYADSEAGRWYLLRLAPGTASPARLTRIPVKPLSGVVASALSKSGRELAVALAVGETARPWLGIYSVATGRLLHSWSGGPFGIGDSFGPIGSAALAWTRGDRAITFLAGRRGSGGNPWHSVWEGTGTLRRLDIATGDGDLAKDSKVIWSTGRRMNCGRGGRPVSVSQMPAVSTDGKTVVCAQALASKPESNRTVRWKATWVAYPVATPAVHRVLCQVGATARASTQRSDIALIPVTLWASPAGTSAVVAWFITRSGYDRLPVRWGVDLVRHGACTPLRGPFTVPDVLPRRAFVAW